MKKYIFILLLIITSGLIAQENSYHNYNQSFGLKASNISGYGFFYNIKVSENVRGQLMGLVYYYYSNEVETNETRTIFNYDVGLEIQLDMYKSKNSRFYCLAGGYYYYDDDLKDYPETKELILNNSYNFGVGVAWELYYKRFILGIDAGYKFFADNKEVTENDILTYPEEYRVTKVGLGISLGFVF